MGERLARGMVLGVMVMLSGFALQCASDPAISGDGGAVDQLLADLGIKDQGKPDAAVPDARRAKDGPLTDQKSPADKGVARDTPATRDQAVPDKGLAADTRAPRDSASPDNAVTRDTSLIADLLKDGIGPVADAAVDASTTSALKRVVVSVTATKTEHVVCGIPGSPADPPAVTLWEKTTSTTAIHVSTNSYVLWESAGCIRLKNVYVGRLYRLVAIF